MLLARWLGKAFKHVVRAGAIHPWVPVRAGPASCCPTRRAPGRHALHLGFGLQWVPEARSGSFSACRDLHPLLAPRSVTRKPPACPSFRNARGSRWALQTLRSTLQQHGATLLSCVCIHWSVWFAPVTRSCPGVTRGRPPVGFWGAERESAWLLQRGGSDGEANYRPCILGLLHTMPLKIRSMLKQLAIGEF